MMLICADFENFPGGTSIFATTKLNPYENACRFHKGFDHWK